MKTAQQWLDKIQEGQMAECVHYEIHKQMGPSVSMLDWIEMIQHDAQDDFTNQVAELKSLVDAGMHESADLCNRLAEAKAENARLAAQWAVAEAKCKEACGECVPSGGYDYFDEVCGLLRVTRGQRDQALEELARLRAAREGKL